MLDADSEVCQEAIITGSVPLDMEPTPSLIVSEASRTEIKRGGSRPGAGRPAITTERPWQAEGISRSTYYERLAPKAPTQISYATDEPRWAVIAYFGQAELSATRELTRIGYETYTPFEAIRRRDPVIPSEFRVVLAPMFSGYGFIRLTTTESREPIVAVRGVREVLRRPDGHPGWVADQWLDNLRDGDAKRLLLPKEHGPVLAVDTKVWIKVGAFEGHRGVVLQCDGVKTQVEIQFFGRPMPVWVDRVSVSEI